ncbi:hypothetical protein BGZ73_002993 [Actinomortierella ambigua]|nr:hypothetical protein BGZ73_002993 [Actinomortierella ambigua]
MSPSKTIPTAVDAAPEHDTKPMFHIIPVEELQSNYLPSLVPGLPYSMCQVGLVMSTLYNHQNQQSAHQNETVAEDGGYPVGSCIHLRSTPFPSPAYDLSSSESQQQYQAGTTDTVYELTMCKTLRQCYISANSEARLEAALAAHGMDYGQEEGQEDEATRAAREAKIRADTYIQEQFEIFRTVEREIVRILNEDVDEETVHFFGVNRIWHHAVVSLYPTIYREGPAIKFAISEKDLLALEPKIHAEMQAIADSKNWTFGPMHKSDAPLMIEKNSLKYDLEYGEIITQRSVCFRDQNGAMLAWAGTHLDLSVAALHVLPEYRKEGLGRLMLIYINLMQIKFLRELLAGTSQQCADPNQLYMHADTESYNVATQKFMLRCGYKLVSYTNWFSVSPVEKS